MTQKHFIALADALRQTRPRFHEENMKRGPNAATMVDDQWRRDVAYIADVCEASNPRFNRQHWLDYIDGRVSAKGRRPTGGKP